ncbi:GcrA family cell cycle regulator [Sphingomonas melonis]|uniref:GcrA cell cycle regulator n=1 Tax=Sphingomonas melonis TaxID=152682 RepID=A0A7Y9K156_9SPHN|nr:GcrA family cell cycle regulator [Sphingomonas melonis]NYD89571.1 GcrA cell cycle regulator [Sphingomonas melonis]
MSWTDERIDTLKTMWEAGQTASQIAEALGGVSRNAVIGKAHRLGLQSRPSPVKPNEPAAAAAAPAPAPVVPLPEPEPELAPVVAAPPAPPRPAPEPAPVVAAESDDDEDEEIEDEADEEDEVVAAPKREPQPILRSVGPGGFVRQSPGEQQPPSTPAPPRRLVPAKPSPEIAGKTTLLDLNDRICKWPLGHPGEPDFHFCGEKVNPGFPYCVAHCGHAYQAQLPRRDRRPPPPLPFGGPRVR